MPSEFLPAESLPSVPHQQVMIDTGIYAVGNNAIIAVTPEELDAFVAEMSKRYRADPVLRAELDKYH
jgi:hypothetical protein